MFWSSMTIINPHRQECRATGDTIPNMMTRRTAVSVLAAPLAARGATATFDPNFGSALDAAAAIRSGKISSVELTKHVFERIDKFQPKLNAFVYQMREEALASARRADEA